jgi:hypothetical protein
MIVFYKNFLRNRMVNLSVRSIKHFIPEAKIICVSLYENSEEDYANLPPLEGVDISLFKETNFKKDNNRPLDSDHTTSGDGHPLNASFFSEGFNIAIDLLKNEENKVLLLSEDHYFTTGETISFLQKNDFTIAYAPWRSFQRANGSILCLKPSKVAHLFPIPEISSFMVETHIYNILISKIPIFERCLITTRSHENYCGDGRYTNSSKVIEQDLIKAGIL